MIELVVRVLGLHKIGHTSMTSYFQMLNLNKFCHFLVSIQKWLSDSSYIHILNVKGQIMQIFGEKSKVPEYVFNIIYMQLTV